MNTPKEINAQSLNPHMYFFLIYLRMCCGLQILFVLLLSQLPFSPKKQQTSDPFLILSSTLPQGKKNKNQKTKPPRETSKGAN